MKKSILILTSEFPPQPGGIGNHAHQLAKRLANLEYDVCVVCDRRSKTGEEEQLFDQRQDFKVVRISRSKWLVWSYFQRIRHAFREAGNADVVLASGKFSLWQGSLISRFIKTKYVAVLHGSELLLPNPVLHSLTHRSLKRFDRLIAVSRYTRSLVKGINSEKITVIPNGFKVQVPEIKEEKVISSSLRLITVGNLTERKGQHNVIRALPLLKKQWPGLEYHMIGIPTDREYLENLGRKLGVEDALIFHGRVSDSRMQELLTAADVFVMLSQKAADGDVEGFGIAILEANAFGLPAIGSLGCGIEDAIRDGYSGRLIRHDDPEAYQAALSDILENYPVYSRNAVNWTTNFSWDRIIKDYLRVIMEEQG